MSQNRGPSATDNSYIQEAQENCSQHLLRYFETSGQDTTRIVTRH